MARTSGMPNTKFFLFDENGNCVFVSAKSESCSWPNEVKENFTELSKKDRSKEPFLF